MNSKVNNLIYAAGADMVNTHRTAVTLKESVNPQSLEKALVKAAVRFPYFSVKLKRQRDSIYCEKPEHFRLCGFQMPDSQDVN